LLPAGANRRVGLAPTGKRRLVTAHTPMQTFLDALPMAREKLMAA
jgi:hypothetical protein